MIVPQSNQTIQSLLKLAEQSAAFFKLLSLSSFLSHSTSTSLQNPKPLVSPNAHETNPSSKRLGVAESVLSRIDTKKHNLGVTSFSGKDILLRVYGFSPETGRRFRRVLELKPDDVLELLLGFQLCCEKYGIEAKKVWTLWEVFKWASEQNSGFKHLPRSCEIMASLLVQVGLFKEVEILLSELEFEGIVFDNHETFGSLIEGYIRGFDLEMAISVYNRMRKQGLVLSLPRYHDLLELLVLKNETHLAIQVCNEMMDIRYELGNIEKVAFENVIRLICRDDNIKEARNLVKRGVNVGGLELSNVVVNEISSGFCERFDFEDAIRFCSEVRRAPDLLACNKIIASLCKNFGTKRANWFMQELLRLGFVPDEITFGILIGWSCHEGNIRNAFNFLSDILSRGLKPDVCSYDALMSGLFVAGMGSNVNDVFIDMIDRGILPKTSTFKVLLAGYCQSRQFDDAKVMVSEMEKRCLIELSSMEDPLSKAFKVLGLDPFTVKVKRDNHAKLVNTEFFDNLGNGLYLDGDIDEYEKIVASVLTGSMIPDFNSCVMKECGNENFIVLFELVDEMVRWGQELSLCVVSTLVKKLCASRSYIKAIGHLFEKMPKLVSQLDLEALNLLVQTHSKKGLVYDAKRFMDGMIHKHVKIMNESYTALLIGLYKKGESKDFQLYWGLARIDNWIPNLEDSKPLVGFLCEQKLMKETLELFESMVVAYPFLDVCNVFVEKLCDAGHTIISCKLVQEAEKKGYVSNHMIYSHLIEGFLKEKRLSEAFQVFDSLNDMKMVPSLNASVLMIPLLCLSDRKAQAFASRELCLRKSDSVSSSNHSALIKAFYKGGDIVEVVNLFKDMLIKGLNPDPEDFNILLQCHCRAENMSKAEELLGVMIRKQVSFSISSYRMLVKLTCRNGRLDWVISVKKLIFSQNKFSPIIIYNILIFHLLSPQNNLLVHTLLAEMDQKGLIPDEVTYNFLVYGFYKNRDMPSSLHYLNTMMSKELRPSARNLRDIISGLCGNSELEKALELCRKMELEHWFQGSTIQDSMVEGLISNGKIQEAESYLDRMEKKGLIPDSINYDNLIKQFCRLSTMNKAVDLVNVMLVKGHVPHSSSYDSLICSFCSCNQLDRAMDFHKEMMDMNLAPSIKTWDVLVNKFCEDGRADEAEKLLNSMVDFGISPTKEMYCCVINRHSYENNLDKASNLLQSMHIAFHYADFDTHWSLISKLGGLKDDNSSSSSSQGFLSTLLSKNGFFCEKNSNKNIEVYSVSRS